MSLALTEYASSAIVLLLGTIAVIVRMRLRRSGQIILQHEHAAMSALAERPDQIFGSTIESLTPEIRHHFTTGLSGQAPFIDRPRQFTRHADNFVVDRPEVKYYIA